MDLTSPLGIIISIAVIIAGIFLCGGVLTDFYDPASVMVTVVPTIACLFVAFPLKLLAKVPAHTKIILGLQKYDPADYIAQISAMSEVARVQGLIALETQANEIEDEYIKSAAMMVADGTEPEVIESRLYGMLDAMTERHGQAWAIYDKGASYGPAFGMLGTVVSLVIMLMNLNFSDAGGAEALGQSMATALITTFYGSFLANVIFIPLGQKLRSRHQDEVACKQLIVEGFLAIQKGMNPRVIKEMLVERLDPKIAAKIGESQGG